MTHKTGGTLDSTRTSMGRRRLTLAATRSHRDGKKWSAGRLREIGTIWVGKEANMIRLHNQWHLGNFCEVGIAGICKTWGSRMFWNELEKYVDF
jgi:hypothetical protein